VDDRIRFEANDLFDADIHSATVVALYLLPDANLRLRPRLLRELKPGTRIVSHVFDMGDRKPDQEVVVDASTSIRKPDAVFRSGSPFLGALGFFIAGAVVHKKNTETTLKKAVR